MSDNDTKPKRHFFLTEIAEILGVNEAIMLNHLIYWIASNSMTGNNHFDGRYWTYNSATKYALIFQYWSTGQIRRILKSLVFQGIIIEGNYNKHKYDRTKWYALKDEKYWMTKYNPVDEIDNWENRYR
mgnify:FL=1